MTASWRGWFALILFLGVAGTPWAKAAGLEEQSPDGLGLSPLRASLVQRGGFSPAPLAQVANDLYADTDSLQVMPAPPASGDVVSLRVLAHNGSSRRLGNLQAVVFRRVDGQDEHLADVNLGPAPPGGTTSGVAEWVWDTALTGLQTLIVQLDPKDTVQQGDENAANNIAQLTVELGPKPAEEVGAQWAQSQSDCCTFHFLTGTAVQRDLAQIHAEADDAVAHVETTLGIKLSHRLDIYLVPRTIGQGGFAMGYLVLSYHDRQYAAGSFYDVLRHEATHAAQGEWAQGGDGITMMAEGLAVWVTGGHFKPEPIRARAKALLTLNRYVPFDSLVNDFYTKQHESSYVEAAGFVQYLVETYGQDMLRDLFTNLKRGRGDRDFVVLDRALVKVYGKGVADLEPDYRAWLEATPDDPAQERDLADTVLFFDTARRYQQALDPTAYFQTPWMPNIQEAERRGLTADYMRHPEDSVNVALETLFMAASDAQFAGDYDRMESLLGVVNGVLDAGEAHADKAWDTLFTDPTAADYLALARRVQADGMEPQRVDIQQNLAQIWATRGPATVLYRITGLNPGDGWRLLEWVLRSLTTG